MRKILVGLFSCLVLSGTLSTLSVNALPKPQGEGLKDLYVPHVDIVLMARQILPGGGIFEVTSGAVLSTGNRVMVVVTVFGPKGTEVEVDETCELLLLPKGNNGSAAKTSFFVGDKKFVDANGLVSNYYDLEPDKNMKCVLTVKVGEREKSFIVFGAK